MATLKAVVRWSAPGRPNVFVIGGAVVVLLLALAAMYQWVYAQRAYIGVRLMGKDLSGLQQAQVQETLQSWYAAYDASKLVLRYGQREWQAAPSELGLALDLDASTRAVFAVGREGNLVEQWTARLGALLGGRPIEAEMRLNEATARAYLERLGRDIDRPVRNARLVIDSGGYVQVSSAQAGEHLNVGETVWRLSQLPVGSRLLELLVETTPPKTVDRDLQNLELVQKLTSSQPFTIEYEKTKKTYAPADLATLLKPAGTNPLNWPAYRMDLAPMRTAIEQMAKQINAPPVEARLERKGTQITISPSSAGMTVDVEASMARVREQIVSDQRTATLEVKITPASLTSAEVTAIREMAQRIVSEPLIIAFEGQTITVTRESLASSVILKQEKVDGRNTMRLAFDEAKLKAMVEQMAQLFDRAPKDAQVRMRDGKVFVMEAGKDGAKVKVQETMGTLASALLAGKHAFTPEVQVLPITPLPAGLQQISFDHRLMDSSTAYYGAIAAKRHNIQLAASRLDGTLVAPGEIFSFNKALGPTRLADGYQMGYAISISGTEALTIPAEAGGICQVVTTLFHSVFWTGLKIAERWPHMYWIHAYGQPPRGLRGLDATVDGVSIDLKFENNTGHWLAIRSWTKESKIYFELWGRDPEWDVEVEGPRIDKIVAADHEVIYRDEPTMNEGQQLQVEGATDGFESIIKRKVTKDGKLISELTLRSEYVPARNVILVYPRTPTPTATATVPVSPTPTRRPGAPTPAVKPAPTATPRPAATPTPR